MSRLSSAMLNAYLKSTLSKGGLVVLKIEKAVPNIQWLWKSRLPTRYGAIIGGMKPDMA